MSTRQQVFQQLRALTPPYRPPGEAIPLEPGPFRELFPSGLRRGMLTEWLSEGPGSGTETLTWKLASHLRGTLIVVDAGEHFYPPAAAALGVPLAETIVVRPRRDDESLWAIEQALRCRGVGVVLTRMQRLESRQFRRLQLAAEQGGTIGILLRPASQRGSPSWAQARFVVRAIPSCPAGPPARDHFSQPVGRRLQIESLHPDGRDVVEVELNDATGALRLVSRLADAAPLRRAAGA